MQKTESSECPEPQNPPPASQDAKAARDLFAEYAETRDLELRNRLVLQHQRLARSVAARFSRLAGSTPEDLHQTACLGLIAAVARYDPAHGVTFASFATATMVGVIKHYLRDHSWLVKAPRRLREAGSTLRKRRLQLETELGRAPTIPELTAAVGWDEERVLLAMEVERSYQPLSLDSRPQSQLEEERGNYLEALGEVDPRFEAIDQRETLCRLIDFLDPREREIIQARFFRDASQGQVAEQLCISQMHVSRLERRALQRLKGLLSP